MPRVSCFGRKSLEKGQRRNGRSSESLRVQGELTPEGAVAFEKARSRVSRYLRRVTGRAWSVSDGDTIEYLARGEEAAQKAIEKVRK